MKTIALAVFDKKIGLYDRPFFVRHIGEAVREWDLVRKDTNTKFGKNPEDFRLDQIGEFNDESGQLVSLSPIMQIAEGAGA